MYVRHVEYLFKNPTKNGYFNNRTSPTYTVSLICSAPESSHVYPAPSSRLRS